MMGKYSPTKGVKNFLPCLVTYPCHQLPPKYWRTTFFNIVLTIFLQLRSSI